MIRSPRPATRIMLAAFLAAALLGVSQPAAALSRSTIMSRAQTWVDAVIPYSQTGWASTNGTVVNSPLLGWRRDCSGFASMTWKVPVPGGSTRTLHLYAQPITYAALQPGDLLVSYDNHAVVFGGWADAEHRTYYAYEMSSSASRATGDGTVIRITPFPYWSWPDERPYKPYRQPGVTENIDYTPYIEPVQGSNRFGTAIAASRSAFADGSAATVVVASGENWPDALGASALAGAAGGPILLTGATELPAGVAAEIVRLGASEVIVVGGEAAVSRTVASALDALPGVGVKRIGGTNRYDTAALIAAEAVARLEAGGGTYDGTVLIATAGNFPDALAASSLAAARTWPILLTDAGSLHPRAQAQLRSLESSQAVILGGTAVIGAAPEAALRSELGTAGVVRVAGSERYSTALKVAKLAEEQGLGHERIAIATGANFPDALAGGVMAARGNTFLLLTPANEMSWSAARILIDNAAEVGKARLLGGDAVLGSMVRESVGVSLAPVAPPEG